MRVFLLFSVMLLALNPLHAQEQLLNVAKQYLSNKDYEKAAATFKQLVEYNPDDESIFLSYLESLKGIKDYATAEKLLKTKLKGKKKQPFYLFELVQVYKAMGESKKANKGMDELIGDVELGDDYVPELAQKMSSAGFFDEAVRLYEKGKKLQPELPYLYAEELALIYDRKGEKDKATEQLLDLYAARPEKGEEIKSTFMRLCREEGRFADLKKRILKRI
jgi:tetratricopeptide (TPR) repeat protein